MKKTLVALSVAALAATSANAATVYNQDGTKVDINGSVRVMLNKLTDHRADLQNDGSRVKVKFSQEIGEGLKALGYIEVRPSDADFGNGIKTKRLYAGLAADGVGTLVFGKTTTAGDNFKLADPTEQGYSVNDATGLDTDGKKVVKFESANFAGFGFETSYTFATDANDEAENANAYQLLAKYENDFDGLGVNAHALYSVARMDYANINKTERNKIWGLAAGVNYADFGFAVDYSQGKGYGEHNSDGKLTSFDKDVKVKAYSLATTYQVAEPVDVYAVYTHAKKEDEKTKAITLGSHYQVAKNVQTYVEYATKKVDDKKRNNGYYAGLRVFF